MITAFFKKILTGIVLRAPGPKCRSDEKTHGKCGYSILPLPKIPAGACLLLLLGTSHMALSAQAPDEDEQQLPQPLSSPWGDLQTLQNVSVAMRDGISISLDIYLPEGDGPWPVLYAAGPYPHSPASSLGENSPIGPVGWYVSQGYAVAVASVRGTGLSEGDYEFLSRTEQQDHYEIIEWIAAQPWSNGMVAGLGAGYYAASQWLMAIQNPPHLECIAPLNGMIDPYREWVYPGGLANNDFITGWYDRNVRLANAYTPNASRVVSFDMRLAQLSHPLYDDYWQIRSSLNGIAEIGVPVFALNDWNLTPVQAGLSGTFAALSRLNTINKILVTNPSGSVPLQQDTELLARELLPFYNWCFNGRRPTSSFIEQPRIRYQVRGQQTVKRESNWPPGNIRQESWFLSRAGDNGQPVATLDREQQPASLSFSEYLTTTDDGAGIRFVSSPLTQPMEITGPVMLELYASSSAMDTAFQVTLYEQLVFKRLTPGTALPSFLDPGPAPDTSEGNTEVMITRGALKASARVAEQNDSSPYLPSYAFNKYNPLSPGRVYRLDIALKQTAYRFSTGNRLVLEIKPVNDGSLPATARQDSIYHSGQYPSRLWLPVVQSPLVSSSAAGTPGIIPITPDNNPSIDDLPPDFDFLDPEALDELNRENGEPQNPVIFVPR